eukprot:3594378-Rhodomonas_salina.3
METGAVSCVLSDGSVDCTAEAKIELRQMAEDAKPLADLLKVWCLQFELCSTARGFASHILNKPPTSRRGSTSDSNWSAGVGWRCGLHHVQSSVLRQRERDGRGWTVPSVHRQPARSSHRGRRNQIH